MRRTCAIALLAAGVALGAPALRAGADADGEAPIREGFEIDRDQDRLPDRWRPLYDAAHPRWGRTRFPDPDAPAAGSGCFTVEPAGAPAVLERHPAFPVSQRRSYRLCARTRATGLGAGRVDLAVLWMDARGGPCGLSVAPGLDGDHPWTLQEVEIDAPPVGAVGAILQFRVSAGGLDARVGLDELRFEPSVRLEVSGGGRAGSLYLQGEEPRLLVRAYGLGAGEYRLAWTWEDAPAESGSALLRVGSAQEDLVYALTRPLPFTGRRILRLELFRADASLGIRRLPIGVLPRLGDFGAGGEHGPADTRRLPGGVDLGKEGPLPPRLDELFRLWGGGALRFELPERAADEARLAPAAGLLSDSGVYRIGLLGRAPGGSGGAPADGPERPFGVRDDAWHAWVAGLLGRWRARLDGLQVGDGSPGGGLASAVALRAAETAGGPARALDLGLAQPVDQPASATLARALGEAGFRAFAVPPTTALEFADAAAPGLRLLAGLVPESARSGAGGAPTAPAADPAPWVLRAAELLAAGAERVFLPGQATDAGPLFDRSGYPTDLWHGTRLLWRAVGAAELTDGVVFGLPGLREAVYLHPASADVVCWRDGETGEAPLLAGRRVRVFDAAGHECTPAAGAPRRLPAGAGPFLVFGVALDQVKSGLLVEAIGPAPTWQDRGAAAELRVVNGTGVPVAELVVSVISGGRLIDPPQAELAAGAEARCVVAPEIAPGGACRLRLRVAGQVGARRVATTRVVDLAAAPGVHAALALRRNASGSGTAVIGIVENRSGRSLALRVFWPASGGRTEQRALGTLAAGAALAVDLPLAEAPAAGAPVPVVLREVGGGLTCEVEAR